VSGPDVRAIETSSLPAGPFPSSQQEFRIGITEAAFDRAVERGGQNLDREIGGVLVGRVGRDDQGPYVLVETTIDALHAEEKGTELTFTHATWEHIHRELEQKHKGKRIVGWYHTHPGFGIFLSDRDQFIHRSFFDLPFQVALVYDPKSREHGVFAWRDGHPVRWRRYVVGDREQAWDGARTQADPGAMASAVAGGAPAPATAPPASAEAPPPDLWSVGVGAIVILILGGLVGWWFGHGSGGSSPSGEADRQALRTQGAEELAQRINVELLSLLRAAMTDAPVRHGIDEALAAIDQGLQGTTEGSPATKEAIEKLRAGREALARLQTLHDLALTNLQRLGDEEARLQPVDARLMAAEVSLHRAVLGRLCSELGATARKAGDAASAETWLSLADKIDPQNAEAHRRAVLGTADGGGK
jgi:proteasome lid subunit RPN8/RPN11